MKKIVLTMILGLLLVGPAGAVTIGLHSSNVGIGTMSWSVSGTDISIWEDWTASGAGFLELDSLELFTDYTVTKYVTNNTGTDWDHFTNELLDPTGQSEDGSYDIPTEPWVPAGFSHSNNMDGLSFAQGSGISRTSTAFGSQVVDELAGRDFIDFFGGLVSGAGGEDTVSYGLRNHSSVQMPFLLVQRPNEYTGGEPIPEPTTMLLFGLGLAGVAIRNRFKK